MSIVACAAVACLTSPAIAAELGFKPSLAISEEVTDNIFETPKDKRSEYITRLQPGITSHYQAPFWNWDLEYNFDYRWYARNSHNYETTHKLDAKGSISLVENRLYLDVSDTYHRVPLDVAHDVTTVNSLFLNQIDQNIATIAPYLLWRPTSKSTLKTGYSFIDTRYWNASGIESQEHDAFADLSYEVTSKFTLSTIYGFKHVQSLPAQFNKNDITAGFRYEYADKSFVFGYIGNSWMQINNGSNTSYLFWNAGVTHDFSYVVVTVESKVQSVADPLAIFTKETIYIGKLEKKLQRGMIGFSTAYSEFDSSLTDSTFQRRLSYSGSGRYEVFQSLTASLAGSVERFYMNRDHLNLNREFFYQYHVTATCGLGYEFIHDLTLSLNYTFDTQRIGLTDARGSIDINKVVVELRKTF
jgi:hypothetical protein